MNTTQNTRNSQSILAALRPRYTNVLVALICVGLAFGYAFSGETPVGRMSGRVVLADSKKPLSKVHIVLTSINPAGEANGAEVRRAMTDDDGRFSLSKLPAGDYRVAASARVHTASDNRVSVDEGQTQNVALALTRSEPDLALPQQERSFVTSERVTLPVRGYADASKAADKDIVRARIYRTRLSDVMRNTKSAAALSRVGQQYEPLAKLPKELLKPATGASPGLVKQVEASITEADR